MQILIQYMKNTNIPLEQKIRFYESLKEPGIGVPKHHLNEICPLVKNLLTNKARRVEGLILLDLILDKVPDQIFSEHLVFFLKQIIGMCANESHAETCLGVLNRLVIRCKSMLYMLRDIRHEVFPQLIQLVTRELAKVPVSCSLLSLTQSVVSLFSKSCGPNREHMERFLFKQIVQAELLNKATCEALARTLAMLSTCVADPETRHDVQTSYLDVMIRSCLLTERLHSQTQDRPTEESFQGTIYGITGETAFPDGVDHLQAKLILWRRLTFQLEVIGALLESNLSKSFSTESLFKLLNTVLVSGGRDEHLSFLHPSLILKTMTVLRQLICRFGDQLILKNHLFIPIFMDALDITLLNASVDLSFMRAYIYEAMSDWLQKIPPSAFYRNQPDSLMKIIKLSCEDVTSYTGPNQVVLVCAALKLQRAVVLSYGHRDKDHVRNLLMQLIPYAIEMTLPFKGVFCTSPACRNLIYELLVAFCTNPNTTLLPPSAEICKVVAEGMNDDDHRVQETCRASYKIISGIINPVECAFSTSYSHALHEHNREIKRLQLTRAERTRPVETQTIESSLRAPKTFEKATNTDVPSVRQAQMDAAIRAISRPGPKSQKRKLGEALGRTQIVTPSDEDDDEENLDEDAEDIDDDEDLDAEDEEEAFGEMECDVEMPLAKRSRMIPIQEHANGSDAAVIIADDDDDDDVVITREGPCSSREPELRVGEGEPEADDDDEDDVEPFSSDTADNNPIGRGAAADREREIVEEVDENDDDCDEDIVEEGDDDDDDDDDDEDDDDMCVITGDPAPARAQLRGKVSTSNGTDPVGENPSPAKVLAVLTPLEDSRENGQDESIKEIAPQAKVDTDPSDPAVIIAGGGEEMMEAVIVPIGVDDNDVVEDLKKSAGVELVKVAEASAGEASEGAA
ncbi:uncharacterized protein LOC100906216 [Galendromus occidentalis]|uniref:Uncharacterized protein LOC100906216 n=1 Tax=Galendromus occidentalis TaxID=34638 RepID=A0AAJ7L6H2_9ACAR|nr:uncharacterized protein LOC100906216 [Galendromus occidentalis]